MTFSLIEQNGLFIDKERLIMMTLHFCSYFAGCSGSENPEDRIFSGREIGLPR
jgi:hypothetical protein